MSAGQTGQPEAPPFVQCVLWTPRKLASGVAPAVEADLVFSQQALKAARDHASSSPNAPVGGVFLGLVREDPTCGRKWVLVETAVRARRPLPEDSSAEILGAALAEVIDSGQGHRVVGWYRTHARTGVYLSEQEARLQEELFGEAWQCAMILAGTAEHPVGGVFQRTEDGTLSRSGYTSFFELVDPSSEFDPGWKRTFAGWSNYQTDLSVALAGKDGVSSVIPPNPQAKKEAPEPESDRPVPDDKEARTAPGTVEPPAPISIPARKVVPGTPPVVLEAPTTSGTTEPAAVDDRNAPADREHGGGESYGDDEESWAEVQIRRTLSAVGRTLGPSSATGLGAPAPTPKVPPVELGDEESPLSPGTAHRDDVAPVKPLPADPAPAAKVAPPAPPAKPAPPVDPAPPALLEPLRGGLQSPEEWAHAHNEHLFGDQARAGGFRRKSRLPLHVLAMAATGLVVLLGGGWLVLDRVGGASGASAREGTPPAVATGELAITGDPQASEAGLRMGQGPLFPRGSDIPATTTDDFLWVGPQMRAADAGPGSDGDGPYESTTADAMLDAPPPSTSEPSTFQPGTPEPATPQSGTREPSPATGATTPDQSLSGTEPVSGDAGSPVTVAAEGSVSLDLGELRLDDPVVAAFEDAFTIFRKEATRYDSLRVAFDDQLAGCNALNLSYRAVRDSFHRLGTRFDAARDHFAGPGLRAYSSAERQVAVIDVHYELSECPPPRGG